MKKVLAGILVATTVLGLVGCGNSGTKRFLQRQCRQKKRLFMENPMRPYTELFEDAIVPIPEEKRLYSERCGSVRSSDSRYRPE